MTKKENITYQILDSIQSYETNGHKNTIWLELFTSLSSKLTLKDLKQLNALIINAKD